MAALDQPELPPKLVLGDVVLETLDAVDLHEGDPLAISPLELGVGRDINVLEVRPAHRAHDLDSRLAQVAARSGVDNDP